MKRTAPLKAPVAVDYLIHRGRLYRVEPATRTATVVTAFSKVPAIEARVGLDAALATLPVGPEHLPQQVDRVDSVPAYALSSGDRMTQWVLRVEDGYREAVRSVTATGPDGSLYFYCDAVDHPEAASAVATLCNPRASATDLIEAWLMVAGEAPHPAVA